MMVRTPDSGVTVEKPTAKVRVGEDGKVVVDVGISPAAEDAELVTSQDEEREPDSDVLGRIKGVQPERWIPLSGA